MRVPPLFKAAKNGNEDAVKTLLAAKAPVDEALKSNGQTPLMAAAYGGHLAVAEHLLNQGAQVQPKDRQGRTALIYAASSGHDNIIKRLAKQEPGGLADRDLAGMDAMSYAAQYGHASTIKLLHQLGAAIESLDNMQTSPLMYAAMMNRPEAVSALLVLGANPEHQNKLGSKALDLARAAEHQQVIVLLQR
jgi:ankyrin repeat protein